MATDAILDTHHIVEYIMRTVIVELDTEGEVSTVVPDPTIEPSATYGCIVCDAGLDEALKTKCKGTPPGEEID